MSTTDEKFASVGKYGSVLITIGIIMGVVIFSIRWFDDAEENHEEDVKQGARITIVEEAIIEQRTVLFPDAFRRKEAAQADLVEDAEKWRAQQDGK